MHKSGDKERQINSDASKSSLHITSESCETNKIKRQAGGGSRMQLGELANGKLDRCQPDGMTSFLITSAIVNKEGK